MKTTPWAGRDDEEAAFARSFALLPVLYRDVRARDPEVARELVAVVIHGQNRSFMTDARLEEIPDSTERWQRYYELLLAKLDTFCEYELVQCTGEIKHYRVHRCIFLDVAEALGAAELTGIICDLDCDTLGELLDDHDFHRNGSNANTLAHGASCREYVWQASNRLTCPLGRGRRKTGRRGSRPRLVSRLLSRPYGGAGSRG